MRTIFCSALLVAAYCVPQGSPPAARPPDYEDFLLKQQPTTTQKAPGVPTTSHERVLPLPKAHFSLSRESVQEHRPGPTPPAHPAPPTASNDVSGEEQVQPSKHTKESEERPVHPKTLSCPTLDPWRNSEPHPDTDHSCEQGFPGWKKEVTCRCSYLPAGRDASGCVTKFQTLCTRADDDDAREQQIQPPMVTESMFPDTVPNPFHNCSLLQGTTNFASEQCGGRENAFDCCEFCQS